MGDTDLADDALLAGFEAGTLAPDQFGHPSHVRVAYLLVARDGPDSALAGMRAGLRRLNAAHGSPDTPTRGYHETVTVAFLRLIGPLAGPGRRAEPSVAFCARHPWLLDKQVLGRYYSPERLWAADAKRAFVEPDLLPLDGAARPA